MSPLTRKTRPIPFEVPSAGFRVRNPSVPLESHAAVSGYTVNGSQITDSEGHPRPKGKSRLADGDIGGNFFTQKRYVLGLEEPVPFEFANALPILTLFDGTVQWYPVTPSAALFPSSVHSSESELIEMGATAISRCKPTKSTASFSTAVGEILKDGIPHKVGSLLWEQKTHNLRQNVGSEYLNGVFGWEPMLHDIRSFAAGVVDADKLTKQYIRDAGRPVRRDYRFPVEKVVTDPVLWGANQEHVSPFNSRFWDGTVAQKTYYIDTITKSCWFEGVFTYALPPSAKLMGKHVSAASQILGIVPDPETLWNLAPWSWAIDWFSNTGDVVSNANDWATDGLVMRYGYVMERSIIQRNFYSEGSNFRPGSPGVAPDLTFVTETKQRLRANPFGFGLSWNGLSPRQLAIAVALGISR